MELTRQLRIVNKAGLHARPCHSIVTLALGYESELRIRAGAREVNGKSILELMTLNAGEGTEVEIRVWGGDAERLIGELEALIADGFGEERAS